MKFFRRTWLNMFVPFDDAMPAFHSCIGNMLVTGTFMHSLSHIVRYIYLNLDDDWRLLGSKTLAISGSFLLLAIATIRITSLKLAGKRSHDTFYFTHHSAFISYYVILFFHGSHEVKLESYKYFTAPLLMYITDRVCRYRMEKECKAIVSHEMNVPWSDVRIENGDVIQLLTPRVFPYIAGQYCDIKVPDASRWQWHSFTIAKSPHESVMKFFINVSGDRNRGLHE